MNAKQGTILIADQMAELLAALKPASFCTPLKILHGSSIGQHFRHILEFYTCLIEGCDSGMVNYGGRRREQRIEESPAAALAVLEYTMTIVGQLDEQTTILVESEFSDRGSDNRPAYPSSIGRELQYAFDHAVHHLAIIRIGLESSFPDLVVPANLGVAPSTLKYRKNTAHDTALLHNTQD
ncbi:MAG: hypothetical protein JNL02_06685 [Saprospiraceae bacterium]|nr:hypothetical protein [Saprospiraceae bacterium]